MRRPLLALLCVCALSAVAVGTAGARTLGAAAPRQRLRIVLPLVVPDAGLDQLALAVSTPGSPRYGQYETIEQLARRFGAARPTRERIVSFLRAAGATGVRIDATGLFADASITAGLAERLFATPLSRVAGAGGSRFVTPSLRPRIPAALRGVVTGVVGLDTQPLTTVAEPRRASPRARLAGARAKARIAAGGQPSSAAPRTGTPAGCANGTSAGEVFGNPATAAFTPNQYLTAYGFSPMQGVGLAGQGERVALIEIDGFNTSDINTFALCFGLRVPAINAFGVGRSQPLPPGGEATLDLEALDAAAPGLRSIDVYETRSDAADTLQALTAPLQRRSTRPQVISASLGLCELATLGAVGVPGIKATERALAMAAISGITFLASSGDQGSADCAGSGGAPLRLLAVNYPASSPWATAVGGTNIELNSANALAGQIVWNDTNVQPGAAGGGGLSGLFRRPSYQQGTVASRFRAVPDVALLSDIIPGYAVYCSATPDCVGPGSPDPWQSVGGTSAAAPLLAGGVALVDQVLTAKRREPLGFMNPLLYRVGRSQLAAGAFSDVRLFGNDVGPYIPGDGAPLGCCSAGPGYDLASGWGSINLPAFAQAALALAPPQLGLALAKHQRPLRRHAILTTVSCAGQCRLGAYADVQIGRRRATEFDSRVYRLRTAGRVKVPIHLPIREVARLRAALRHGRRVDVTVFGVLITGRRRVLVETAGTALRLGP